MFRAIHIEMLEDLSTDAFINALHSFIAVRGTVRQIHCDQGTNFVGANREFMSAIKTMNQEQLKKLGREFIMNVPSSSHNGWCLGKTDMYSKKCLDHSS